MDQQDLERIARAVLRDLGASNVAIALEPQGQGDRWRMTVSGDTHASLIIRCGRGTTPQFVRTQIFEQLQRR